MLYFFGLIIPECKLFCLFQQTLIKAANRWEKIMDKNNISSEHKKPQEPSERLLLVWLSIFIVSVILLKVMFFR
ncbi:hypothetical protein NIES2101_37695 [Calothrix sp. HK-06]|nr:hypothetical protein NIES2101_37695 [Calothrix sp. HK-06]